MKYTNKNVENYVKFGGIINFLKKYNVNTYYELEKDINFVVDVINHSNNIRHYIEANKYVKMNINFIKSIIENVDNKEIVKNIVSDYLSKERRKNNYYEIAVLAHNKNINIQQVNKALKSLDNEYKEVCEEDFSFFNSKYITSNLINDYVATKLLNEIIMSEKFYVSIHREFNTFDKFNEYGTDKFILNKIKEENINLFNYINKNKDILKKYDDFIYKIQIKWDNFSTQVKRNKNAITEEMMKLLVQKYSNNESDKFSYLSILKLIARNKKNISTINLDSLSNNEKDMLVDFDDILYEIKSTEIADSEFYEKLLTVYELNDIEYNENEFRENQNNKAKILIFKKIKPFLN